MNITMSFINSKLHFVMVPNTWKIRGRIGSDKKFSARRMASGKPCIKHFMEYFIKIPSCYTARNNRRILRLCIKCKVKVYLSFIEYSIVQYGKWNNKVAAREEGGKRERMVVVSKSATRERGGRPARMVVIGSGSATGSSRLVVSAQSVSHSVSRF
ncbi:hypothetical protein WN48_04735 [Eufriesea mexicana]|nr:hypothetical protein WN48_04735 [Eufriesea mexicana]